MTAVPRLAVDPSDSTYPRVDGAPTPAPAPDSRIPPPKAVERDGGGARRKRRPKDIGTADETAVVRALRLHGFPQAERRSLRGALDCGDVTGTPGVCWEIKGGAAARNASDRQIAAWLDETETERVNAHADIGVLIVARKGIGPANADRWWALMRDPTVGIPARFYLADACRLLHMRGYGDPDETP